MLTTTFQTETHSSHTLNGHGTEGSMPETQGMRWWPMDDTQLGSEMLTAAPQKCISAQGRV